MLKNAFRTYLVLVYRSISIKMEVDLFIYFFHVTIFQNYWADFRAVFFCKIFLVFPRKFIAPKSVVFLILTLESLISITFAYLRPTGGSCNVTKRPHFLSISLTLVEKDDYVSA